MYPIIQRTRKMDNNKKNAFKWPFVDPNSQSFIDECAFLQFIMRPRAFRLWLRYTLRIALNN